MNTDEPVGLPLQPDPPHEPSRRGTATLAAGLLLLIAALIAIAVIAPSAGAAGGCGGG